MIRLLRTILDEHDIHPARVVGHSDVAPDRKEDPGEKFPWARLETEGLAVGPATDDLHGELMPAAEGLQAIGYAVDRFGIEPCVTAFQRRFLPQALGRGLDEQTQASITAIVHKINALHPASSSDHA